MPDFILRPSVDGDIEAITAIYAHWVQTSSVSFEVDPPDAAEMARRRADILARKLPYLVAESEGTAVGYAYATLYRPRAAYRFSVEDSVYLHPDYVRRGLGRRLVTAVIAGCENLGYRQMLAVIGGRDNLASISLHQACGFTQTGILRSVGFKFGRWEDTVLMQRPLGSGDSTLPQD